MRSIRPGLILQELRAQARRYVLVALSMLLGVLGIVGVSLANSIASDMLVAREEQLHGREASYEVGLVEAQTGVLSADADIATGIRDEVIAAAGSAIDGILIQKSLAGRLATDREFENFEPGTSISVIWATGDPASVRRIAVVAGTIAADMCYPGSIALNQAAASLLRAKHGDEFALSLESAYGARLVEVVGVIADGEPQPMAYAPWNLLACAFPDLAGVEASTIQLVTEPARSAPLRQLLSDVAQRHGLTLDGGLRRIDTVANVREQVATLTTIFTACAVLLLIVSALGIASVGIASVTERSRELVVRRAFGARRRDVFMQVIIGALVTGVFIGLIAFALAVVGTYWLIPTLIPVGSSIASPAFPALAGLTGLAAAIGTSVLGGLIPAFRATRLPIARALRN